MDMNLEYFYATEEWNEEVAEKVEKLYKDMYEIDITKYVDAQGQIYTMWNRLVNDIYGESLYSISNASELNNFLLINGNNYEFLKTAKDRYELYDKDIWIMASLTIAYLNSRSKGDGIDEEEEYLPERKPQESYAMVFKDKVRDFIRYERKYGKDVEDFENWKKRRTGYVPKDKEFPLDNNVNGVNISYLTIVNNIKNERLGISYALKKNRKEYKKYKYTSREVNFITDSIVQEKYENEVSTEDCLLYAKYVNPELVRRYVNIASDDTIRYYKKLLKYNSFTWQFLISEMLYYLALDEKNMMIGKSEIYRPQESGFFENYGKGQVKLNQISDDSTFFLENECLEELEGRDWYFFIHRRKEEFLKEEFIKSVNEKLKVLSLGLVYLYEKSENQEYSRLIIDQMAIGSYIELHELDFMNITYQRIKEMITTIRDIVVNSHLDSDYYSVKNEVIRKLYNDESRIIEDNLLEELLVEYCIRCKTVKTHYKLNKGDSNLTAVYAYLQEITIKYVQQRFMK